ncbi:hypothetical protein, partial [Amycolatopsis sp. NPDC059021]|uniref:hypothetical protein n=1 Tax=Amycolatopsis sp. NPDC059021 TaxID=3346704 RepID=UPI00366FBCEB
DLLSTTPGGELRYFPNNRATNPGGGPFNTYQVTGSGWNTANRIITNTTEQPTLAEAGKK